MASLSTLWSYVRTNCSKASWSPAWAAELMNQPVDSLGRLRYRLHPEP